MKIVFEDITGEDGSTKKSLQKGKRQCDDFEDMTVSDDQIAIAYQLSEWGTTTQNVRWQDQLGRRKVVPNPKRKIKELGLQSIKDTLTTSCCEEVCLSKFYMAEVENLKSFYWEMDSCHQRQFIRDTLRKGKGEDGHHFFVNGRRICEVAWKTLYGVKDTRFRQLKREIEIGVLSPTVNAGKLPSRRLLMAKTWLEAYITPLSEKQPDRDEQHLPGCLTKAAIFEKYKEEIEAIGEEPIKISRFLEMWTESFPNVKIKKGKGGFQQCSDCTIVQTALLGKPSKEEKEKALSQRSEHLALQTTCRQKYYKHIKKAKQNPEKYISVIIDNMDQAKTNLPRFRVATKTDVHLTKMYHHVTGVKCHGEGLTQVYTWTDVFHPDSNITMNCLVNVLDVVCKNHQNQMPEVLYLQADNSAKDNKNNFLLAFLATLVKEKVFKKIKLDFLMVGHTHEDVDQLFSRISQRLHVEEAHTLPDLHRVTANAFTPAPEVIHLPSIWDIKPHLSEVGYCQGISTPHVFKFTLRDDRVIMHYKDWPLASEPYRHEDVTEMCMDLCQRLVPVSPNPKVDPILKQMNDDLEKWARSGRLSREEIAWWQMYLSDLKESAGSRPVIPLPSQLGHFSTSRPTATLSSNLIEALRRASEKQNRVSTVRFVRRRTQPQTSRRNTRRRQTPARRNTRR